MFIYEARMGLLTYACALLALQLIQLPGERDYNKTRVFHLPLIYALRVFCLINCDKHDFDACQKFEV